jgi:hypothetical protein
MALRIIKKEDEKPEEPKLPEGGDRFLWNEIPPPVKKPYAQILKMGEKKTP